jgi:hypothetical protein
MEVKVNAATHTLLYHYLLSPADFLFASPLKQLPTDPTDHARLISGDLNLPASPNFSDVKAPHAFPRT